ncbi:5'-nucleotidase [Tropicibacter naphthalenivorans]|uniref:5'-nucleotidase n=1 Tax=Tropicibacter naphthalenivorans TaxID=441103 RepID=A0A0P1G622_9RHOB|nr:5'-nucleotidase [Tropicibacter naphthalenivorans]CUH77196.1 5'-nucleotidase [Tropicibacter naphthalenivorans]SMC60011.1 5'-nucleotidase [Tropicibacter naphthalenivorans]
MKNVADLTSNPLRIGISTRALFDLEEEHIVFEEQGVEAYVKMQREREDQILKKGSGFQVVERLLGLNASEQNPMVEVVLMSRNSPDLSLRAFKSILHYELPIKVGSFTSGRSLAPYLPAWGIDLFLSSEVADVQASALAGAAAATLVKPPVHANYDETTDEVRIVFDGDAVVFSAESDEIYKKKGLEAFFEHEKENAQNPMQAGPFQNFLIKLSMLRSAHIVSPGVSKVRIGLVTARNAPAHERVVYTLRAWGTPADEAHFVGPNDKAPILRAMGAHIFFDDQKKHVDGAAVFVPAGHVPGPHDDNNPVIPSK